MILKNTSSFLTAEVRQLVTFALRNMDTRKLAVHVKNSRNAYGGRAYKRVPYMSKSYGKAKELITVRIGKPDKFPTTNKLRDRDYGYGGKGSPIITYGTWQEAMIGVTAHEGHHIVQFRHNWPLSEVECEKVAAKRLEEWKNTHERN